MSDSKESVKMQANINQNAIFGHKVCQTREAKWLCLEDIHDKMYRPNFYDIGGTYIEDLADFWFMCKTEQVGRDFLLHLFIRNKLEASFNISLSNSSDITIDKKSKIAYLSNWLKDYDFKNVNELTETYLTTFHFTELDVELLKEMSLYIPVKFPTKSKTTNEVIDDIKANYDFGELLNDPIGSDFIIESLEGTKFHVHKILLAAHSEVFKAMLKEDTAESQNGYVKMTDVNSDDLQCILQFIYTGTINNVQNSNCINLLILADKYDLRGLRELTTYVLSQQLSTDNALEILQVSDIFNSLFLKKETMKFIKQNKSVMNLNSFKELQNVELVHELYQYLVSC